MHIGIVIHGPLNDRSGGYMYDNTLVKHLRAAGDQVTVFSLPERPYLAQILDNTNITFWRNLARAPLDLLLQDELCHLSLAFSNRWLRAYADYPVVSIVHHLKSSEERPVLPNQLIRWIEQYYLQSVDGYLVNSEKTLDAVTKAGGSKPATIAYPGGDRLGPPLPEDKVLDRTDRSHPLQLLAVGNVTPRKGIHTIIEALSLHPQQDWKLRVAGSLSAAPQYVDAIRQNIYTYGLRERVELLGRVSDARLKQLMANSDVFVLPSTYEGFGIVYLEAFSHGMPVIANEKGGHTEYIDNKRNGFIIRTKPVQSIASALSALSGDKELLRRMSLAALRTYRTHPTWSESTAKARAFVHKMAKRPYA